MADYTYDADAQAAYLRLSHDTVAETLELVSDVYVDVDGAGSVVGIELVGYPAEVPQALAHSIDQALRRRGFSLGPSWTPLAAILPMAHLPR
jgi:uncharacterized protein YuzE